MYVDREGRLVVSASDLTRFIECRHVTGLDLSVARDELTAPEHDDPALEVLYARGLAHEQAYLQRLRDDGLSIVEIAYGGDLREAERQTVEAMRAGADVVYQGTFFDGTWRGHADFLEKRPGRPSRFGDWAYDLADTKLARRLKVAALLQMASYAERLTLLQGVPPEFLTVVTGDGQRRSFRLADCAAYTRRAAADLMRFLAAPPVTYPDRVRHCAVCRWDARCDARRRSDDNLSLVAGMRRDHARLLAESGVGSLAALGRSDPVALPAAIGAGPRERLAAQARLQHGERVSGCASYELLPAEPGRGLCLLPEPSRGDLFFDIEGDPYVGQTGLEYLFGISDTTDHFTPYWGHDPAGEKAAFEGLVDHLMGRWAADPAMHVYHYAAYERTALQKLSARYDTRIDEVDRLLRGGRLVDLYAVVRQGLRVSKESYSLKSLEAFYDPDVRAHADVADAAGSIVAYERWLADGDPAQLAAIERYNAVDCRSTRHLRTWLEGRRAELVAHGEVLQRPADGGAGEPGEALAQANRAATALRDALALLYPGDDDVRLLGDLLDWHRREARAEWWDYFHRLTLSDEELVRDSAAVGELGPGRAARAQAQSTIWRHDFPPQEAKFKASDGAHDSRTSASVGVVTAVDPEAGWIEIRRQRDRGPTVATSLVPAPPIPDGVLREAVLRVADDVRLRGMDAPGPL
ncbi:MAG: TM0106 family RecB-like putative nuclease, partial [Actinomycetota bacterium]|nr:TM0106 family RecB-like putative nuclease [Actinomycetota bacterium]